MTSYVAPTAHVGPGVLLGHRASVWFHASVRDDGGPVVVGPRSNVQDHAVIHRPDGPVRIGELVTIGHRARIGAADVGDLCVVGSGAVVLPGTVLPDHTFVAVGSCLHPGTVLEPGMFVAGNPARALRPVTAAERAYARGAAERYLSLVPGCSHPPHGGT